ELASTSALIRQVEHALQVEPGSLDGKQVFELAKQKSKVLEIIEQFYEVLAQGIATIIFLLNPETIVIGGAIASRTEFIDEIKSTLCHYVPPHMLNDVKLERATLGNQAGMLGALAHFLETEKLK
ncbi:MAG: ROK family protein, partial [Culicoidibacterales bacterium]